MTKTRPAFKIHGGKYFLAQWIIENFPENYQEMVYIEPYAGGLNTLFNKEKSKTEIINDLELGIIQIYRALRDEPKEFSRRLSLCKYSEETFIRATKKENITDYLEHAVNDYILRRMSRGGMKKTFAWSERQRGGKPGEINAWETALKELPSLSKRLQEVFIFNKPAIKIIESFNSDNSFVYADPPYLHETRVSKNVYDSEMSTEDHIELARLLNNFKGKVILSGYQSPLYKRLYKDWNTKKKKIANHSSQQKIKEQKTEIIWMNY